MTEPVCRKMRIVLDRGHLKVSRMRQLVSGLVGFEKLISDTSLGQ